MLNQQHGRLEILWWNMLCQVSVSELEYGNGARLNGLIDAKLFNIMTLKCQPPVAGKYNFTIHSIKGHVTLVITVVVKGVEIIRHGEIMKRKVGREEEALYAGYAYLGTDRKHALQHVIAVILR